jgi:hypothetical protein
MGMVLAESREATQEMGLSPEVEIFTGHDLELALVEPFQHSTALDSLLLVAAALMAAQ